MKKWKNRRKRCRKILACLSLILLLSVSFAGKAMAREYVPDKKGSFYLTFQESDEDGKQTVYPGIHTRLYKVGSVRYNGAVNFDIDPAFQKSKIDFNSIRTASDWVSAAKTLADMTKKADVLVQDKTSDTEGKVSYTDLEQGVYLLVQEDSTKETNDKEEKTITMAPMILTMPFMEEEEWIYEVQAYPKLSTSHKSITPPETNRQTEKITPPSTTVKTGDSTNFALWGVLMMGSALLMAAAAKRKKQKR